MERKDFQDDFTYLYERLKTHPEFQKGKDMTVFDKRYESLMDEITDHASLVNAMTALTVFFEDGHTNIEIPYTLQDECLRIPCKWQDTSLVLTEEYDGIEVGAEIIAVENLEIGNMLKWGAQVIPHENLFLVKSRLVEYPYMNYHIFSKMNLTQLFGEKQSVEVNFLVNGVLVTKKCPYVKYDGFWIFKRETLCIMKYLIIVLSCTWMNVFLMKNI